MKRKSIKLLFIDFVNTFSLWVVFGSLITYWFFARAFNQNPDLVVGLILAFSIWVIYTFDHLLDGLKTKGNSLSLRHNLHYKYKRPLWLLISILSALVVYLVLVKLDNSYLRYGVFLFVLTTLHLSINHLAPPKIKVRYFIKEVFIAFVVSLGFCGLPLCTLSPQFWPDSVFLTFSSFFLLNLGNLMMFSYFDYQEDLESEFISSAGLFGESRALYWAKLSCFSSLILALFIGGYYSFSLGSTLAIMNGVLLSICFKSSYFKLNGYYRFLGDFIYLLPAVALSFL